MNAKQPRCCPCDTSCHWSVRPLWWNGTVGAIQLHLLCLQNLYDILFISGTVRSLVTIPKVQEQDDLQDWFVVLTPLKNVSQLGLLFPIYGNIKTCLKPATRGCCKWWLTDFLHNFQAQLCFLVAPSCNCAGSTLTSAQRDFTKGPAVVLMWTWHNGGWNGDIHGKLWELIENGGIYQQPWEYKSIYGRFMGM